MEIGLLLVVSLGYSCYVTIMRIKNSVAINNTVSNTMRVVLWIKDMEAYCMMMLNSRRAKAKAATGLALGGFFHPPKPTRPCNSLPSTALRPWLNCLANTPYVWPCTQR